MELAVNMPEHDPQVGTGVALDRLEAVVVELAGHVTADALEHGVEVDRAAVEMAGEHGAAADHDRRHVEPHGGHEHAGHDLVAARHQHELVERVRDRHRLDRVGDQFAAGQRVEHALVVHGDAVADAHHAELERRAAGRAHAGLDGVDDRAQVHVAGHDLAERVGDADERPLHLGVADAEGAQQRTMRSALMPRLISSLLTVMAAFPSGQTSRANAIQPTPG